jgi:hypothetical protein
VCVLCFVPEGHLPVGDVMLAQKLALESFEVEAIKVANMAPPAHENAEGHCVAVATAQIGRMRSRAATALNGSSF